MNVVGMMSVISMSVTPRLCSMFHMNSLENKCSEEVTTSNLVLLTEPTPHCVTIGAIPIQEQKLHSNRNFLQLEIDLEQISEYQDSIAEVSAHPRFFDDVERRAAAFL